MNLAVLKIFVSQVVKIGVYFCTVIKKNKGLTIKNNNAMKENIFNTDIFTREIKSFINSTIDSSSELSVNYLTD